MKITHEPPLPMNPANEPEVMSARLFLFVLVGTAGFFAAIQLVMAIF